MGNIQAEKPFEVRSNLLLTSILKTLTFSTRQSLNLYIHQLRSRMTLRSSSLPRIVYFNQITTPKGLSCQTLPNFKLEVYFQDYGREYSQQTVTVDQCRCMELLGAIDELKDRYGCFMITLSSIFVKREDNFQKIIVWINNQVQQCNPSNKCDQKSMCQSIIKVFQTVMKGKCFENYGKLWKEKHILRLFSMLKQAIIKSHIQPLKKIEEENKQIEKVFTFKHILGQPTKHTILPGNITQIAIEHNKPAPDQWRQQRQILQQKQIAQSTSNEMSKLIQVSGRRQKIPPLNMKCLLEYLNEHNSQSQRVVLSRNQSIQQVKQLYNEQKQYEDIVTTARSPGRNYVMRKSDQLTIFPNQYQIKFQNKHKINCQAQIKISYQAFRKAMNTIKFNQNSQNKKCAEHQKPILSYR